MVWALYFFVRCDEIWCGLLASLLLTYVKPRFTRTLLRIHCILNIVWTRENPCTTQEHNIINHFKSQLNRSIKTAAQKTKVPPFSFFASRVSSDSFLRVFYEVHNEMFLLIKMKNGQCQLEWWVSGQQRQKSTIWLKCMQKQYFRTRWWKLCAM